MGDDLARIRAADAEAAEMAELREMFQKGATGTDVFPRGMVIKFEVAQGNRAKADKERREKEERQRILQEMKEEQYRSSQELRAKRGQLDTEAYKRWQDQNAEEAAKVREAEKRWKEQINAEQKALEAKAQARMEKAAGGYGNVNERLAAEEDAANAAKRAEAQRIKVRQQVASCRRVVGVAVDAAPNAA